MSDDAFRSDPQRWFLCAFIVVFGGSTLGLQLSVTPSMIIFQEYLWNCSRYSSPVSCTEIRTGLISSVGPGCVWNEGLHICSFPDYVVCADGGSCNATATNYSSSCFIQDHACVHKIGGWNSVQEGIFGSAMQMSSIITLPIADRLIAQLGRHTTVFFAACMTCLSSVVVGIGFASNSFPFQIAGRVLSGFGTGMLCVVVPLYSGIYAPVEKRAFVTPLFAVGTCAAMLVYALVAFALDTTIDWGVAGKKSSAFGVPQRILALIALASIGSLLTMFGGIAAYATKVEPFVDDDQATSTSDYGAEKLSTANVNSPLITSSSEGDDKSTWPLWQQIVVAIALPVCMQCTGINAMIVYAPVVAAAAGMSSIVGTVVIMGWNLITTIVCISFGRHIGFRLAFLLGVVGVTISNAVMVVVLLSTASGSLARHTVSGCCALLLIAAASSMGVSYGALATRVFREKSHRDRGMIFVTLVEGLCSVFMIFSYPVILKSFPQESTGQCITFAFGLLCGTGGAITLRRWMRQSNDYL